MKGFGKFITFVGVTGAALAGLWYFCEMNKEKCECACDSDDNNVDPNSRERSYVSLDPEMKEEVKEDLADASGKAKKAAKDLKDAAGDAKNTMKKAVKSAAQDIMAKAEDKARGVGLVKDKEDKEASEFEFEDFDKNASQINIE